MLGRPVLLSIAAAAIGSLLSVTGASAGCHSCGCGAPVVYSYAAPCGAYYAGPPMYVVNQGPAFTLPVPIAAEPTPAYSYPYVEMPRRYYGPAPYYGDLYPRYRHHHWRMSYGYDRYADPGFRMWRHHGRPYIGMRRFYGDRYRRFAHVPRPYFHMQRQFRHMNMQMRPHMRGPAPGFVHPQVKRKPF
jgi:hypothetical protein